MFRSPLLLSLFIAACASPPPRGEVDAAVTLLRETAIDHDVQPIESELMQLADEDEHRIAILNVGADAFAARVHAMRAARESIDIQVFAWAADDAGIFLFQEALRAAQRGVRVRLLADQLATGGAAGIVNTVTAHENLEVRFYNPIANRDSNSLSDLFFSAASDFKLVNHRMHNKVMVVDRKLGIVGGRNIEERYFDLDPQFNFIDRDALVLGPALEDIARSFDEYWSSDLSIPVAHLDDIGWELIGRAKKGEPGTPPLREFPRLAWVDLQAGLSSAADVMPHSPLYEADLIQFISDPPRKRTEEGVLVEWMGLDQSIFEMVDEFMVIQGNYLILSESVFRELRELQERQPHAVIVYSTNSLASTGCFHCHAASRKQRERMVNHGLHIYEMRPEPGDVRHFSPRYELLVAEDRALPEDHGEQADDYELYDEVLTLDERAGPQYAIHAKSVVIDGDLGMIGSHNFDPRSRLHNTEAAVMFYGVEPVAALERELLRMTEDPNSWTVAPEQRIPVWNEFCEVMSVTSRALPIFDVWPLFYTTNFELREGCEPVLYDDPRFYENYRDVGEFPEVPLGLKKLNTRLFGIFGGFLVSLL